MDALRVAACCAQAADEKKADGIAILDVRDLTDITDYFVICTGMNDRQIRVIADETQGQLKKAGIHRLGLEGYGEARWVLLDLGDVVFHIFDPQARAFYDLEMLWGDAPRVEWQADEADH